MCFHLFWLSAEDATQLSSYVAQLVSKVLQNMGISGRSQSIGKYLHFLVHFGFFCIEGMLLTWAVTKSFPQKKKFSIFLSFLAVIFSAVIAEVNERYLPWRYFQWGDLCLNILAGVSGLVIAYAFAQIKSRINFKKVKRSRDNEYRKEKTITNQQIGIKRRKPFQLWVAIFGFLGINVLQILIQVGNVLPAVQFYRELSAVEQVHVTQRYEYVVSKLGEPISSSSMDVSSRKTFLEPASVAINVEKAVFLGTNYLMIAYFDDDNSLFGYFLISLNESFAPKPYYQYSVFSERFSMFGDGAFGGKLAALSSSCNFRNDGSNHLGTDCCLIGVGLSSFGYGPKDTYIPLENQGLITNGEWIDVQPGFLRYDNYKDKMTNVSNYKINVFSIFVGDGKIDPFSLLRKETEVRLGLTEMEVVRLTGSTLFRNNKAPENDTHS